MTAHPSAIASAGRTDEVQCAHEERANHLSTQFLRRVAHDIASPAGVTMTVLDELAIGAKPELVAMARRGLRRLLRLSEQLALVADLEAGAFAPDTAPEDLRSVVQTALDNALGIDGRRDITADCSLPDARVLVDVDRRLLVSVVREVIGNALRLATSRVTVALMTEGDDVLIRVEDDGMGFKDEVRASLGERFTPRAGARGLGLSISIAKEVLAAHGGALEVGESTLPPGRRGGKGGAVTIRLPTTRPSMIAAR
ncbi:MAG: HAMP domain-containing histidine kinase [Labilithrix sp.]|nr:HAMP domain-containing histidine kinase [Labilithrix sp.]MCW5813688.1 HAMP domain-containing histidine kinase [Labilithrix sp.]